MEKISAISLSYMDEARIAKLIKSLEGVDEIIISLDEFSTDKTREIAESMGAKVIGRSDFWEKPTEEDIERFEKRFGFKPHFTTDNKFCYSGNVRNEAMTYAKNDWVFFPDSDEIVTWNLDEIQKILPDYDQINCNYISTRDEEGNPTYDFKICKLFRKSRCKWIGRVHECITATMPNRYGFTDKMKIDHYHVHRITDPKLYSRGLLSMEYAVIKDYDARTSNYLAREYWYAKEYDKAIKLYLNYLKVAKWLPEIVEAYIKLSRCYWDTQQGDKSREVIMEAIKQDPMNREAVFLASVYFSEPWSSKWRKLSEACDNSDALFRPKLY